MHNWMYSFMPGVFDQIYLVGFCKACRQAFSEIVPVDKHGQLRISKMSVPRDGCEPIDDIAAALNPNPKG